MDLAVDFSNFTTYPLRVSDVQCMMANGVRRGIVQAVQGGGRYPPGHTAEQLRICAEAPIRTDAYILPFDGDGLSNLRAKRSLTNGFRIGQWWFDLEEPMGLDYVRFVLAEMDTWPADEGPTGIYTAHWYMSNQHWLGITEFSNRKLWLMQRPTDIGLPFSGWTDYALRQYWLDASLCGITGIDVSIINPAELDQHKAEVPTVIHVGEGMQAQMGAAGDHPFFGHKFMSETDEDGQSYSVEICYGLKGLYVSANSSGQWENTGPLGGAQ